MIEEAPFVEMPTRVAMMSDWPTDHPANDVFRNRPPATRRDRNGGRTLVIAFGVALGVGGIAAGVFFGLRHASASKPKPSASATVESTNDAPPSVVMPEPSVTAAAPSASSTQLVSASSAAVETAPDLSKLLSYEAYLTVSSSSDAEVLVQGVLAGRTNERLLVRCGSRNVRLRKSDGTWLTKGEALKVPCMKATTLRVDAP